MWLNYIMYFGKKKLVSYQSYTYFLQIQRRKAEVLDYAT